MSGRRYGCGFRCREGGGYPPARRVRGAARRWEEAKERWNGHASKHAESIIRWCEASLCDARSTPGTVLFVRGPQCGWEPYKPRVDTASPISRNNFVAWTGPVVFGPQPPASFGLESGWTPNRTEPATVYRQVERLHERPEPLRCDAKRVGFDGCAWLDETKSASAVHFTGRSPQKLGF